jgi:hypothetical protein
MAEKRIYNRSILEAHPAFEVEPLSPGLQAKLDAAAWPEGLMDRVLALRGDREVIEQWLDTGFPTPDMLEAWVTAQEMQHDATLVARQATWEDVGLLVDLCANAPEDVDGWTVTVERSPNPYAQFRLQEHPSVIVLEDLRVALGMAVHSVRNTYIAGERTSAHQMSGWRIRDGFRGLGLSRLLQNAPGPGASWFGLVTYWFVRSGNASSTWISKVVEDMEDRPTGFEVGSDTLTASVWYFGEPERGERSVRVRNLEDDDIDTCLSLINRTHSGLDLFRPYSEEYFDQRMSDPSWGPKPFFYPEVYGRPDYRVLEVDGTVVACAGLWDRGRDLREVWATDTERFVVDPTAVMDFGYAEGHEQQMAELLSHLLAESATLGRSGMLASLEYLPDVAAATEHLGPRQETRQLHVMPFSSPDLKVDLAITRPYIDLAYW